MPPHSAAANALTHFSQQDKLSAGRATHVKRTSQHAALPAGALPQARTSGSVCLWHAHAPECAGKQLSDCAAFIFCGEAKPARPIECGKHSAACGETTFLAAAKSISAALGNSVTQPQAGQNDKLVRTAPYTKGYHKQAFPPASGENPGVL